ncbi:MAG: hypothetical protein ACXVAU_15790 [Mucilaginibacter sp.]
MKEKIQSLIGFPIDEKSYKVDLELQDRYTAYSAEILRLALLGIAGYGFLLKDIVLGDHAPATFEQRAHDIWLFLAAGAISLCISAILALQHRVCATDCVSSIAAFIRKKASDRQDEAETDRAALRTTLKKAAFLLRFSVILLAIGASCIVLTFCYVLWQ